MIAELLPQNTPEKFEKVRKPISELLPPLKGVGKFGRTNFPSPKFGKGSIRLTCPRPIRGTRNFGVAWVGKPGGTVTQKQPDRTLTTNVNSTNKSTPMWIGRSDIRK